MSGLRFGSYLAAAATILTLLDGCRPPVRTVLASNTVRTQRARAVTELGTALARVGYSCTEEPNDHSIVLQCRHERGPVAVEIRNDIGRSALSFRYWVPNEQCGSVELLARMEAFNLSDRAGGTRTYCVGKKMVLEFETLLPSAGVESSELGELLTKWQTTTLSDAAQSSDDGSDAESGESGVKE